MAVKNALKTGNWSDATLWPGGIFPAASDTVYANGFTVTIDQNVAAQFISTEQGAGGVAGGRFQPLPGITITADVRAGSTEGLYYATGLFDSLPVIVAGNVLGSATVANKHGLHLLGAGPVQVTGNTTGNLGNGVYIQGSNVVSIGGNAMGGSGSTSCGVYVLGTGAQVTIAGNSTGGLSGTNCAGTYVQAAATVVIQGNAIGGGGGNASNPCTGVTVNNNTANVTVIGSAIPSESSYGALNSSRGTLIIGKAVGAQVTYSNALSPTVGVRATDPEGVALVKEMEFGPLGQVPTEGYVLYDNTAPISVKITRENLSTLTLVDVGGIAGQLPAPADVRFGVGYNSNARVGTMRVPPKADVRKGVLVDVSDVGEAYITAEDIWNFPLASLTVPGSIGERVAKAISAEVVGQITKGLSTK